VTDLHPVTPAASVPPGRLPVQIRMTVNFTVDSYVENARRNLVRGLPEIGLYQPIQKESLLICGNGPSLALSVTRLRKLAHKGHRVVACNKAYQFLKEHKVPVWAQAVMDAQPHCAEFVKHRDPITYLISSMTDPGVLDVLEGQPNVFLWHAYQGGGEAETLDEYFPARPMHYIAGGSTVTLRMLNLGYVLGFRDFQLYGVDSCLRGRRLYATGEQGPDQAIIAKVGDREFLTTPNMADQAFSFQKIMRELPRIMPDATVSVHGDGLIVEMVRESHRNERKATANVE
jgi:hypothetical protein